jgi:hypothetical protein
MSPEPLYLKRNDLQPYYYAQIKDQDGNPVNIVGAAIVCTMKSHGGTLKINRQSQGIVITDGANGKFEYRWQAGDTDAAEKYYIEFEVTPEAGGKFTVPARDRAAVIITDSLDGE